MAGYIGPIPVPQATQTRETFTATASQTTFNTAGYQAGYLDVFMNGVKLIDGSDYTATNGSDVVLSSGAAVNDLIEVVAYTAFEVLNQNFTGTTTVADLTVSGNLTVDGTTTTINSTTLNVDDINITVASGAADAAAANGAGLTVDGANATFNYASSGDKWTMNKDLDITGGLYTDGIVNIQKADGTFIQTVGTSNNTGYINWESNGWTFYTNGPLEALRIGSSEIVANEDGRNYNFRVEGDTDAHVLFVDASTNRVGVSTSAPPVQFTVGGNDGTAEILLWGNNANSTSSRLIFGGQSPYTSEYIQWRYNSDNNFLYLETDTTFGVGEVASFGRQYGDVTFNDGGASGADFRIEANTNTHALFLDAGSGQLTVGTSTPKTKAVFSGSSGTGSNLGNADALITQASLGFITIENVDDTAGVEAGIIFRAKSQYAGAWAIYSKQNGNYTGDLVFRGRTSSGSASAERMRLKGSNGRLGLNEDSPTSLLHLAQPSDDANGGLQIRNSGNTSSVFIYQEGNNTVYDEGSAGVQIFKTGSAERFRITNNGVTFNGDTGAANSLSDYEEGTFDMTLSCNGTTYTLSARYCKVGQVVTITNSTQNYWVLGPSAAGQAVTITTSLPFTPKVSGGIVCSQYRALRSETGNDEASGVSPVIAWRGGSSTIYLDATDREPGYEPSNRMETDSTRTNVVLFFSGSYLTDS